MDNKELQSRPGPGSRPGNERERELIAKISRGDRDAFRELYLHYHRRLAKFLTRMTHRYEDAEEIINDTLWTVWQRAGDFRDAWHGVHVDHGHCLSTCAEHDPSCRDPRARDDAGDRRRRSGGRDRAR